MLLARSVRSFFLSILLQAGQKHQNCRVVSLGCIHHFFSLAAKFNPYFQNGGQKTKMAAKNRETNITGLIIDLQSRVICQNVRCLNMYLIWPLNAILII